MTSGDKISQLKNKIILENQMLEPRIANQLIVELRDHTMYYILEDDDLVDRIEEKELCMVTIKEGRLRTYMQLHLCIIMYIHTTLHNKLMLYHPKTRRFAAS